MSDTLSPNVPPVFCSLCGRECLPGGISTGYGTMPDGAIHCFACCAVGDALTMEATGKATLYLTGGPAPGTWEICNWPGTLKFRPTHVRKGRHNIAGTRYDVYFRVNGAEWHGVRLGENNQILRCKRTTIRFNANGYPFRLKRARA